MPSPKNKNVKKQLRQQIYQRIKIQCDQDQIEAILFNMKTRSTCSELYKEYTLDQKTKNEFKKHIKNKIDLDTQSLDELQDIQKQNLEMIQDHIDTDEEVHIRFALFAMVDLVQPLIDNMDNSHVL